MVNAYKYEYVLKFSNNANKWFNLLETDIL